MKNDETTWSEVAKLAYGFLESLPHGWLAHTSGDVGLLNDFYIKYREASKTPPRQKQKGKKPHTMKEQTQLQS